MSKIYSYAEFQKIAKVGMRVKAVEGKVNGCDKLDYYRNVEEITMVDKTGFAVDNCYHWFRESGFLELLDDEPEQPERGEITWTTLKIGDMVRYERMDYTVADIGIERKILLLKRGLNSEVFLAEWLRERSTIIQPTKLETISLADAEKALGKRIIV